MMSRLPACWALKMRHLYRLVLVTCVSAPAGLLTASAAEAHLPLSPVYLGASYAYNGLSYRGLQVEPNTITYTGDGTGLLGGSSARDERSGIHWTRWGKSRAFGTGFNQLNDCNPFCAAGHFHGYPVRIEMWQPRTLGGILVFTRLTIFYVRRRPPEASAYYTFTDSYKHGYGYGWGPPDLKDYCSGSYGVPPAPGCSNTRSLP